MTPTSYLILIKTFTSQLKKKRNYIFTQIKKFEKGLEQLAKAQTQVGELQAYLKNLSQSLRLRLPSHSPSSGQSSKSKSWSARKKRTAKWKKKVPRKSSKRLM